MMNFNSIEAAELFKSAHRAGAEAIAWMGRFPSSGVVTALNDDYVGHLVCTFQELTINGQQVHQSMMMNVDRRLETDDEVRFVDALVEVVVVDQPQPFSFVEVDRNHAELRLSSRVGLDDLYTPWLTDALDVENVEAARAQGVDVQYTYSGGSS